MNWILSTEEIQSGDRNRVGGKGYALSLLAKNGFRIPRTVCITSDAYHEFVLRTGLRERILLELHRKDFKEMRWEEIWDCATRIRNMFLTKPLPDELAQEIRAAIGDRFRDKSVAVRSSAPEEDDAQSSFAELHESYINVTSVESILKHIRLVWASLWSDAALLYRQEIGLDVEKSSMAVVIQETVAGDRSGVVFTQNPNDENQGIIESVYGLNQGLVDGTVEPDRWIMDRDRSTIVTHTPPERKYWIIPGPNGVHLAAEIRKRWEINHKWVNIYWADFIPYAHGVGMFGQGYNDAVQPDDPYEFIDLLTNTDMASIARNNMLMDLAGMIRNDQDLAESLKQGDDSGLDDKFRSLTDEFIEKFGDLSCAVTGGKNCVLGTGPLYHLLLEMAKHPSPAGSDKKVHRIDRLHQAYINSFDDDQKVWAEELLELARSSYQLRDDDNITFVVPLATAVVERRGGMLIHGAIIAREYGLPCITGISDATTLIETGDQITVDGYLGIVTLGDTGF